MDKCLFEALKTTDFRRRLLLRHLSYNPGERDTNLLNKHADKSLLSNPLTIVSPEWISTFRKVLART